MNDSVSDGEEEGDPERDADEQRRIARVYEGYGASPRKRRSWSAENPGNAAIRAELVDAAFALASPELAAARDILDVGCGSGWCLERLDADSHISAMLHGLKPERVKLLREALGIDRRTLERWRQWWLGRFVKSSFWQEARARFMPPLCLKTMPLSLCESFEVERRDRLLDLLKFLTPITTPAAWKELVM